MVSARADSLSNTLPGIAILLLSLGIIQRDGLMVRRLFLLFATTVYFAVLGYAAFAGGQGLSHFFGCVIADGSRTGPSEPPYVARCL